MKRLWATLLLLCLVLPFTSCFRDDDKDVPSSEKESESESENVITEWNGLRILVVTDIHYHAEDADDDSAKVNQYGYTGNERMQMMVDNILEEHESDPLHAVLVLGDLGGNNYTVKKYLPSTDENGFDPETSVKENYYGSAADTIYQVKTEYLDQLTAAGIPVYCLPGNHDAYPAAMWRKLFGYDKDYVIEFPEQKTAILMLDLYGFDADNVFFTDGRETLSVRKSRSAENREALRDLVESAAAYDHVILCAHQHILDADALAIVNTLKNVDVFFVGDGHRVADFSRSSNVKVPTYMFGMYSYCIKEETKVQNGFGDPYVFRTEKGMYADPTKVDTRTSAYASYDYYPATEAELNDKSIKKVYMKSPAAVAPYFRWNYAIVETDNDGANARCDIIYPAVTYHGVSPKTGHLLTPHYGMFPSVNGDWTQEYVMEELFDLSKKKG